MIEKYRNKTPNSGALEGDCEKVPLKKWGSAKAWGLFGEAGRPREKAGTV